MTTIPSFKQYLVEEEREVFFTFGRMNPPTIGHGKLLNVLSTKAGRNPYKVYLSHTQDGRKNPLEYRQKVKHIRKMFPKHSRNVILDTKAKTVFDAATKLYEEGYNRVTMVVGSDRTVEFKTLLEKYNGVKGRHGFYNFEKINIVSAGERDPDAGGVEGMSASKQRENAKNNNFTAFSQGVPSTMSNNEAKRLFNDIRNGLGMKESTQFKNHVSLERVSETREQYIEGNLFEEGDRVRVKSNEKTGYVHRLGANYVIVALDEGRVSRQWLEGVEKLEEAGFAGSSTLRDLMPDVDAFLDRMTNSKKYKQAVRLFLDLRKKNPKSAYQNLRRASQIADVDVRSLDKVFRDMVKKGKMPKHLINYPTLQKENYLPDEGTDAAVKHAKKMTPKAEEAATRQDPDIKDRKGTQPASYHSGLSKAQKVARDRQFKKQAKMSDDNPKAYKPAPGDKTAKTKQSKYTAAYKRMFGENELAAVKKTISREKEQDAIRHDRMMDRARLQRAQRKSRETRPESTNPVAKNMNKYNKPATHRDRKKDDKRGYTKHKGKQNEI